MSARLLRQNLRQLVSELGSPQSDAIQLTKRLDEQLVHLSDFALITELFRQKDTRLTPLQMEHRNAKAAIVVGYILKTSLNSSNKEALLSEFQNLLFDSSLPVSALKRLQQPLAILLAHHRTTENYCLQLKTKELLKSQQQRQSHCALSGWQKWRDRHSCDLALMMIDGFVQYAQTGLHLQYGLQIAELFVCYSRLLQKIELTDYSRHIYAQWYRICRRYFLQLAQSLLSKGTKKAFLRQSLQSLVQKFQLLSLGRSLIEYRGVQHTQKEAGSAYCPQCVEQLSFNELKEMLELRVVYFELLLSSFELAESVGLATLIPPRQQLLMLGWILVGIDCFTNKVNRRHKHTSIILLEIQYRLQSKLFQLYYFITKKIYVNVQRLIDCTAQLNQSLLFPSLEFTPYELHLFQHDPATFFDIIDHFSSCCDFPSPKVKAAQLITYIADLVPVFQAEFTLMCKYHLERATACTITDFDQNVLQAAPYRMSTQASLLILTLFASSLATDEFQVDYFKALFQVRNLAKLNDISLALALHLAHLMDADVLTDKAGDFDGIDLGLCSKRQTVREAALRCLFSLCKQAYYPRHTATILSLIEANSDKQSASSSMLLWNILKTTISCHYKGMRASTLNDLLLSMKKTILKHRVSQFAHPKPPPSVGCNQIALINGIEVCQLLAQSAGESKSTDFMRHVLMQIVMLYPFFRAAQIKEALLQLMRQLCRNQLRGNRAFNFQLLKLLPRLLADLDKESIRLGVLVVLELLVLGLGRLARPKLWRKVYPAYLKLLTLFQAEILQLQSDKNTDELQAYSVMIVLQRLVLPFGSQITKKLLYPLVLHCRKLLDFTTSNFLHQRATTLIFSCSLYLREAAMFATMEEFIRQEQISNYEKEMILGTIEVIMGAGWAVGGLSKYEYLVRMLYQFILQAHHFGHSDTLQEGAAVADSFSVSCRTQDQFESQVLRVYKLFKDCKRSAYLYLCDIIQPQTKRAFQQKLMLSEAKDILMGHVVQNQIAAKIHLTYSEKWQILRCNPFSSLEQPQDQFSLSPSYFGLEIGEKVWRSHRPILSACRKRIKLL